MVVELTFREGIKLRDVVRNAFRSRAALAQVVFDRLGQPLETINPNRDYEVVVTTLLVWAEAQSKTADLITGLRIANPADQLLAEFEGQYSARRQGAVGNGAAVSPARVLTVAQRTSLVEALMRIQVFQTYNGRSNLLIGIPGPLNRNADNAQADLDSVLDQLDGLGPLNTGARPLILLLDNAMPYARDWQDISTTLQNVRQQLQQAYGM